MKEDLFGIIGAVVCIVGLILTVTVSTVEVETVVVENPKLYAGIAEVIYETETAINDRLVTERLNRINEELFKDHWGEEWYYKVVIEDEEPPLAGVPKLNRYDGTVDGPSGKETYYNLNMKNVIKNMRDLGYSEEEYPFSIRQDGVKMLGDYVMIAANLKTRPKGTILQTSLGLGIVCDTGDFVADNPTQIDIAVDW